MQAINTLICALQEVTKEVISERDSLYEGATDAEGNVLDKDDRRALAELDEIINKAHATILEVKSQQAIPEHIKRARECYGSELVQIDDNAMGTVAEDDAVWISAWVRLARED